MQHHRRRLDQKRAASDQPARHSFTSALANAGVSPELRMKLTGHKSAEIHRGYTHLEMDTLKDALHRDPDDQRPDGRDQP